MTEEEATKFLLLVDMILERRKVEEDEALELRGAAKEIAKKARNLRHAQALMDREFPWGASKNWLRRIQVDNLDSMTGRAYHDDYLTPCTLFVHEFNDVKKEDSETRIFVPYTGNEHNRRVFPHLLLSIVAKHEFKLTGYLPDYFEPCVGSGQIYMNADPSQFGKITLGDINPFVLSVYFSVQRGGNAFIDEYAENAVFWDQSADVNFGHKLNWLSAVNPFDDNVQKLLDDKMSCAIMAQHYLWLMNRSQLMPKLRAQGGVIGAKLFGNRVSNEVRVREVRALKSLSARLVSGTVTAPHTILRADLAVTAYSGSTRTPIPGT